MLSRSAISVDIEFGSLLNIHFRLLIINVTSYLHLPSPDNCRFSYDWLQMYTGLCSPTSGCCSSLLPPWLNP